MQSVLLHQNGNMYLKTSIMKFFLGLPIPQLPLRILSSLSHPD